MTTSDRARTLMATTTMVEVGILDQRVVLRRHAVDARGTVLFDLTAAVPRCAAQAVPGAAGPVVDLLGTDVSSVAGPDRVRGVVRMSGPVGIMDGSPHADLSALLDLRTDSLVGYVVPDAMTLEWHVETGGEPLISRIEVEDYASARVDALGGWEDGWVAHLDAEHGTVLHDLATRHTDVPQDARVRPVLADEHGIVLSVSTDGRRRDVRIAFPRRVSCACEAVWALNAIIGPDRC